MADISKTKTCTRCNTEQPIENFYQTKRGFFSYCRTCCADKYRQANPIPQNEKQMLQLPGEEWRIIPNTDNAYSVSNLGRVRRNTKGCGTYTGRILSLTNHGYKGRYKRVSIGCRAIYVHRLVAAAFLRPDPNRDHVNHKDGNPSNNAAINLEYVTPAENIIHAKNELMAYAKKLQPETVKMIRQLAEQGLTHKAIGKIANVHQSTVTRILNKRIWSSSM